MTRAKTVVKQTKDSTPFKDKTNVVSQADRRKRSKTTKRYPTRNSCKTEVKSNGNDEEVRSPNLDDKIEHDVKLKSNCFVKLFQMDSAQIPDIKATTKDKKKAPIKRKITKSRADTNKKKQINNKAGTEITTAKSVLAEKPGRNLRKRNAVNYRQSDVSLKEVSSHEQSEHIPVYRRKLEESPKPRKKIIDIYDFFSDDKQTKKKKKARKSDSSFKIRSHPKKVTWTTKAKEALERLGLNVTSGTLKQDIQKLIEAKTKLQQDSTNKENVVSSNSTVHSKEETPRRKINIISQVIIKQPLGFTNKNLSLNTSNESLNISQAPIANSTMISGNNSVPWRPALPVKYNPHLLKIKTTSLPSVDQDIILDATFTERALNNTAIPSSVKSKTDVQQSILNFVSNNNKNQDCNNTSLFNIDEYSPFKSQATQTDFNNSQNLKVPDEDDKERKEVKRNLFKDISNVEQFRNESAEVNFERQENIANVTNSNTESKIESNDIGNYFGFTTFGEDTSNNEKRSLATKTNLPEMSLSNITKQFKSNNSDEQKKEQKASKERKRNKVKGKENVQSNLNTRKRSKKVQEAQSESVGRIDNYFGFASSENIEKQDVVSTNKNGHASSAKPTRIPVVLLINIIKRIDEKELIFVDEFSKYDTKLEVDKTKNMSDSDSENETSAEDGEPEVPLFMDLKPKVNYV